MSIPTVSILLREGAYTLETLEKDFHIHHRRHTKYKNLVLLKYDQIDSPMNEILVRECRGLILDEENKWQPVSRSFDKFFNYGESNAATISWNSARVYEKLDGSMIQMYWYKGQWRVGTTGTPDACGEVGDHGITFEDLFWKVFIEKGYTVPEVMNKGGWGKFTFIFELMTPLNRVVVKHLHNDLKLLGIRDTINGAESWSAGYKQYEPVRGFSLDFFPAPKYDPTVPGGYDFFTSLNESFANMNPLEQEGYVVCDKYFNRVKVKHPGYLKLHHMIDGFGPKAMLEVIRSGETSEVLASFPEHKVKFQEIQAKFDAMVEQAERMYEISKDIESQKEFASQILGHPASGVMFNLRKGKINSIRQGFQSMQIDKLREIVGI